MAQVNVSVGRNILEANERLAAENRKIFIEAGVLVLNIMSSPGAGKTSLLERTAELLADRWRIGVIEGDIQTSHDAERVQKKGVKAVQINTDGACHLDAGMVRAALPAFDLKNLDILIVENVGNLVCPAEFNLGEHHKLVVLSVAEGDDKPAKYPLMFNLSKLLIINKIDLLPYVDFNLDAAVNFARSINPKLDILKISCRTREGLDTWVSWLAEALENQRSRSH